MKKVKLGEVFDLQMGKTPARNEIAYWGGCNKWVSIADLSKTNKYIEETKEFITDKAIKESGIKSVPANTVIMSFKLSIGKTAITKEEIYTNEAIMAFIDKKQYFLDVDYLYHLFSSMDWSEGSNKAVLGLTLNKATLSQKYICIPSLEEQKEIADRLDKVSSLIEKRKTQLKKLDELIKSRFIEMFGDVFYNYNGYKLLKIGEVVKYEQPTKYIVSSENYNDFFQTPVLTAGKSFILGYTDETNDIFYGSKEKVVIFDDFTCDSKIVDFDFKVKSSAMKILHMTKDINVDFFYHALKQNHYNVANHKRHWISIFEIMEMGVPSIDEQNVFSSFVEQTNKMKLKVQKSINQLETLKKSLMQQYFG